MPIVSVIVLCILLWCLFFFLSLSFGVDRETPSSENFGGIKKPYLWHKLAISGTLAFLSTAAVYGLDAYGLFDAAFRPS